MVKIKENFTIDSEISDWIRENSANKSEFVNNLLQEVYKENANFYTKIEKNMRKIDFLYKEIKSDLSKIDEIRREGNRKERQKAKKFLQEMKVKQQKEEQEIHEIYKKIKKSRFFEQLKKCENIKDFDELAVKMKKEDEFDFITLPKLKIVHDDFIIKKEEKDNGKR